MHTLYIEVEKFSTYMYSSETISTLDSVRAKSW